MVMSRLLGKNWGLHKVCWWSPRSVWRCIRVQRHRIWCRRGGVRRWDCPWRRPLRRKGESGISRPSTHRLCRHRGVMRWPRTPRARLALQWNRHRLIRSRRLDPNWKSSRRVWERWVADVIRRHAWIARVGNDWALEERRICRTGGKICSCRRTWRM